MENTTPQTTENQVATTKEAWTKIGFSSESKIGMVMNQTDLKLQAMVQKSIAKIKIPQTVLEIAESEKLVVELRKDFTDIQTDRKKLTSKFDAAISRLMEPENTLKNAVPALTDAILQLKKVAEQEASKLKYKDDEIKRVKETIATHISNHDATCKRLIIDLVDKAYSFALGNGDVKAEEVSEYISKIMKGEKAGEDKFKITPPMIIVNCITNDEVKELWDHLATGVKEPMMYRQDLKDALDAKFEFYTIALKNKVESLKQAAEDKQAAEAAIQKQAAENEVANKLNAISVSAEPTLTNTHKALKKVYTIDMVGENWSDVVIVTTAFMSNLEKCKAKIRVKNIWNLSVAQMAVALCAVKNEDEAFAFSGLKFMLIDKL